MKLKKKNHELEKGRKKQANPSEFYKSPELIF